MAAVLPTTQRTKALDVVRGFAVLGILLANIPSFAGPEFAKAMASFQIEFTGFADRLYTTLHTGLVVGKFRSTLAILFGVGIWLQYSKRQAVEGNWPGGYVKRSLVLAAMGLFHGFFVWYGDILFAYAVVAILACLTVTWSDRARRVAMGVLTFLGVGMGVMLTVLSLRSISGDASMGLDFFLFDASKEVAVFAEGRYLDQLAWRSGQYLFATLLISIYCVALLPLFLAGIGLGKAGAFRDEEEGERALRRAAIFGWGVGLPLNTIAALLVWRGEVAAGYALAETLGGPVMAFGFLASVFSWGRRVSGGFAHALAAVGRISLTTYLLQSILCTFVFYSWGLGLFDQLSTFAQLGVVAAVWTINLLVALFWQSRGWMGPFEWVQRSLTESRRLAVKAPSPPAAESPPAP